MSHLQADTPFVLVLMKVMMVAARNVGARAARAEFILFIDDDNEIDRDMIKHLIESAQANPRYAIIGPSMHYFSDRDISADYFGLFSEGLKQRIAPEAAPGKPVTS